MNCRFVSSSEPRVVAGRHAVPCTCDDRELGCLPCPELHCVCCGREHAKAACTGCLEAARSDLQAIGELCASLPEEAAVKGAQSEAAMLWGPAADPEAWRNYAMSAVRGRLCRCGSRGKSCPSLFGRPCPDAAYLEDCRDEQHPLTVLGGWEQIWRDHLDHHTETTITLTGALAYLDMQIGYMADQIEPAFDEFARELRGCRAHLEDVLRDGDRAERGAPCLQCERPLILVRGERNQPDHWECPTCRRVLSEGDYWRAVYAAHQAISDRLTADAMAERIGVKASVIRVWGARDKIRKHGRDQYGITLYDVADAIKRRDEMNTEKAG